MPHSQPEKQLCSACHERPATCHSKIFIGGVSQVSDLCSECFESVGPAAAREVAAAMRDARCRFCGGPATVGGIDYLALSLGEHRMEHECLACLQELNRYTIRV